MQEAVIEIKELTKKYDRTNLVLDEINLKLNHGDMAVIEGKSGSGKSTLMNILGLLDSHTAGCYKIDGVEINNRRTGDYERIRAEKIGFVFQAYHLIENLTVKENVLLPYLYNNRPLNKEVYDKLNYLAESFCIENLINKKVSYLSGGEKQRVAIVRAILKNPEIIIADEPTGNLDVENTKIIIDAFRKLRQEGRVVIMVTHNVSIATDEDIHLYLEEGKLKYVDN